MKYISTSVEIDDVSLVGGKGHNLQKLVSWEANVPEFFVITTDAYDSFKGSNNIPSQVAQYILALLKKSSPIVLRSSMTGEDQFDASFAGIFETILEVTELNWKDSLLRIYDSLHSLRVKEYLELKKLNLELKMAVVAQVQINVEKSGVLFTRSPVFPTSAVAIDSGWGMGEGVVSGTTDVDHCLMSRNGDFIKEIQRNKRPVLSLSNKRELLKEGLKFERLSVEPSDIEWGYLNEVLYIFQIRPITRTFPSLHYFVDTNLSESYPGTVSPLTSEFVKKAYENVFVESAKLLGASGSRLETLKYHYARILGCVDNHLYYNLEHYYAILRPLPGGEKNIENWHKMIGGKPEGLDIPYHDTRLNLFDSLKTIFKILLFALSKEKINKVFLNRLELIQKELEARSQKLTTSVHTIEYLSMLINRPMGFGLTVVNDVFIMFGLGHLSRKVKKLNLPESTVIDLLKVSHGIDSLLPLREMDKMVKIFTDQFVLDFESVVLAPGLNPYPEIFKELETKKWITEVNVARVFIQTFGDRSFEELKLESLPLKNDPALFLKLIQWIRTQPLIDRKLVPLTPSVALNWLDIKILKFTKECIAVRESTRLWRGKFYHVIRELILRLELQLKFEDPRFATFKLHQFFSITHLEWLEFSQKKISFEDIEKKINDREAWRTPRHFPEIIIWSEEEKLPVFNTEKDLFSCSSSLNGQGVSPGIIEGTALVLDNPETAFDTNLKNFILITRNTDPAWVYIMSRSLGLISEKGSLLSHTAIIGRELGVPTLVGVKHATQIIPNGARIRIDGTLGTVEIL